jgi:hypothetical protein
MKFEETAQNMKPFSKVRNEFPFLLFLFIYKNKFLNFFLFLKLMVLIMLLYYRLKKIKNQMY